MRSFRLLLLAAGIALLTLFGFAGPASAAGDIGHAEELCIEAIEAGGTIDDCQAAPNPIVPEINEVIWGTVGFLTVFGLLAWKGFPAVKKGMDARTERIRADLEAAENQRVEAEGVKAQYEAQLADARAEAARILEEARQAADEVKATLVAKAEADVAEARAKANADIEAAKAQAVADLRGEVASLAIGAAEEVVGRSLDRETNVALVEAYINQVGADR